MNKIAQGRGDDVREKGALDAAKAAGLGPPIPVSP
jgi:hypothetical protein